MQYDGNKLTKLGEKNAAGAKHYVNGPVSDRPRMLARIFAVSEDNDHNIWFGTVDTGAWRYDGETLTNYTHADGLTSFEIQCIYRDKKGELWFGLGNGTVCQFDGERFQTMFE